MHYSDAGVPGEGKVWLISFFAELLPFERFTASDWLKRPVAQARRNCLINASLVFLCKFVREHRVTMH